MEDGGRELDVGGARGWFVRLVGLREGDLALARLGALCSMLVMMSYYVLKPIREEIGAEGADDLVWMFWATFGGTLVVSPLFSAMVAAMPRGRFIAWSFRGLAAMLLGFAACFWLADGGVLRWSEYVFFAWLSVFNMFVVSVMWSLMADVSGFAVGRRAFGVIAAGSSVGGLAGAALTGAVMSVVGASGEGSGVPAGVRALLVVVSVVVLECAVRAARAVDRRLPPRSGGAGGEGIEGRGRRRGPASLVRGAVQVSRSPYLIGFCLYLFLHSFIGTAMYFEQSRIARALITDRAERTAYMASIDVWVNALSLVVQLVVVGRVMAVVGTWAALVALPLVSGASLVAIGVMEGRGAAAGAMLGTLLAAQAVRRVASYAMARPAKETLFTVVPRAEKYQAKNFIDTVVYRGSDAGSATVSDAITKSVPPGLLAFVVAPIVAVWVGLGLVLGSWQGKLAADQAGPGPVQPGTGEGIEG